MAVGTPLTSRMVLEGAFLMLSTPKSVTVLMVSGTVLMVLTVRSDTVLTVCGTIFTPDTAVSDTVLTASGTLWTSCCPLDRAMLPVDLTKLKGVRRTSCIAIVYMSPITQILDPCQSDIMTSCHFSVSYLNYTKK